MRQVTVPIAGALFFAGGCWAYAANAAPPADTDRIVQKAMSAFGAPGLALAVVEDGHVTLARGYGVRRLNTSDIVDAHTTFPIGSETKAFTATALAILIDRKKLSWDDRVVDRLPGFQMYDPYATAHMTIRDLLTHRSGLGLGEGDLLIIPGTTRSRADIVHALRFLQPVTGFREKFAYDNILYIVAGALLEAVSGQSWESFITQNIFKPVGMLDAQTNYVAGAPNGIALHARTDGLFRGVGTQAIMQEPAGFSTIAPAGGINASATDMARWMNVQLAGGALPNGSRLVSREQATQLWAPVVVVPADEFKLPVALSAMQPDLQSYALGWFVECYHGHMIIEHSGAVFGALAMMYLIPESHVGISVTINSEDSFTRRAVMFHLLDHYLQLPPTDWIAKLTGARANLVAETTAALQAAPQGTQVAVDPAPSTPLDLYVGTYVDPWYGGMTISRNATGGLSIRFDHTPGMEGELAPAGQHRFRTHWSDRNIEDAYVDFKLEHARVHGAEMKPVSPLADFSFDFQDLHFLKAASATKP